MISSWHLERLLDLRKNINELEHTIRFINEHMQTYNPELDLYYKELREFNAEIERLSSNFGEMIDTYERTHTATRECEGCKDFRVHNLGNRGERYTCRCKDLCVDCIKVKEGIGHECK